MKKRESPSELSAHFPQQMRELLTATGKHFIERVGPEMIRHSTLQVLLGHNVRTQTEPLTRQRIAEVGGAVVAMFEAGLRADPKFFDHVSTLAITQLNSANGGRREKIWPAQWALGLTGKGMQNVLRSDPESLRAFIVGFEGAIDQAAANLESKLGPLQLRLSIGKSPLSDSPPLGWTETLRITTALGCAELAVRGSDKSRYGKLFERLVLGSALTILGFEFSAPQAGGKKSNLFWLSDSSDERECDATAIVRPGVLARFDIGFIGAGNPEIVRDKLSRFAREIERGGKRSSSTSFVIVDRYPTDPAASSLSLANRSGTSLIQMSMSLWPRELAKALTEKLGHKHPLAKLDDTKAKELIEKRMGSVDVMSFIDDLPDTEPAPEDGQSI